jgi:hypothetical protein
MLINAKVQLELDDVAKFLKSLSLDDLEKLEMKISGQEKEVKKRMSEIKNKKVKLLTESEVFDV